VCASVDDLTEQARQGISNMATNAKQGVRAAKDWLQLQLNR